MVWRVPAARVGGGEMYYALWVITYNKLREGFWSDFGISDGMGAMAFTGEVELMQGWRTFPLRHVWSNSNAGAVCAWR